MVHNCECGHTFEIAPHERAYINNGTKIVVVCGTGKNMAYRGDMNREYAVCPKCGRLEHQFSAEARDQGGEEKPAPAPAVALPPFAEHLHYDPVVGHMGLAAATEQSLVAFRWLLARNPPQAILGLLRAVTLATDAIAEMTTDPRWAASFSTVISLARTRVALWKKKIERLQKDIDNA